jgi:hypothetical protein
MSDDAKLPAHRSTNSVAPRDEYLSSPVRSRSLIGRAVSRWVAGLNTRTVKANTEEVRALTEYARERGNLADATLDAERRIAHYMFDRDDIIADDRETHRDQMEEQRFQRELNRRRREEVLKAIEADHTKSASQREYDQRIAKERNEAALAQAEWETARARWGRDAFDQSLPLRKERTQHIYAEGALDKEIEMLLTEGTRDQALRDGRRGTDPVANTTTLTVLDQLIAEADEQIELARATHASDEILSFLYAMRSRLSAKRASAEAG